MVEAVLAIQSLIDEARQQVKVWIYGKPVPERAKQSYPDHNDELSPWRLKHRQERSPEGRKLRRRLKFSPTKRDKPLELELPEQPVPEVPVLHEQSAPQGEGSSSSSSGAVFVAPNHGRSYHVNKECRGLNAAKQFKACIPCNICIPEGDS